jgi:hypothetical protein
MKTKRAGQVKQEFSFAGKLSRGDQPACFVYALLRGKSQACHSSSIQGRSMPHPSGPFPSSPACPRPFIPCLCYPTSVHACQSWPLLNPASALHVHFQAHSCPLPLPACQSRSVAFPSVSPPLLAPAALPFRPAVHSSSRRFGPCLPFPSYPWRSLYASCLVAAVHACLVFPLPAPPNGADAIHGHSGLACRSCPGRSMPIPMLPILFSSAAFRCCRACPAPIRGEYCRSRPLPSLTVLPVPAGPYPIPPIQTLPWPSGPLQVLSKSLPRPIRAFLPIPCRLSETLYSDPFRYASGPYRSCQPIQSVPFRRPFSPIPAAPADPNPS